MEGKLTLTTKSHMTEAVDMGWGVDKATYNVYVLKPMPRCKGHLVYCPDHHTLMLANDGDLTIGKKTKFTFTNQFPQRYYEGEKVWGEHYDWSLNYCHSYCPADIMYFFPLTGQYLVRYIWDPKDLPWNHDIMKEDRLFDFVPKIKPNFQIPWNSTICVKNQGAPYDHPVMWEAKYLGEVGSPKSGASHKRRSPPRKSARGRKPKKILKGDDIGFLKGSTRHLVQWVNPQSNPRKEMVFFKDMYFLPRKGNQ